MAETNYVTVKSEKKKKTALILCCLGFAALGGLHYFYVGRIGRGILYFFTCGLFLFGTIFDLIKIATGGFVDNAGAPLRQ
ncbi:TM2 domain-containing protein [Faecalispora jeddahensis]|uniref:TM2 domain-containing protein n=1 Tax=Faecalispora jeddahensis TaxID=1414721 RepID=UPI0027B8B66C|nr:TM2 domain-containing protein [Faecalispora jeddahensis]